MFRRQAVIDRWQQCLAEAESLAAGPPSRFSFYYRMRVRLFRFLLACYSSGDWRVDDSACEAEDADDDDFAQRPSAMPFVAEPGEWDGKPPKAGDSIRTALEHIHAANEGAASAASMTEAGGESGWIAATAQSAGISPQRCCRLLRGRGTQARQVRRGDDVIVEVPRDDLDKALRLIAERRRELRIRRQDAPLPYSSPGFVVLLIGWLVVIGLPVLFAFIFAAVESRRSYLRPWLLTWLLVWVICASFQAWLTGRARRRRGS
jgi:hypothetical protein